MSDEIKNRFYFQGEFFETSEEMFEYATKWQSFPLDQKTAERILKGLNKDIIMNIFLVGKPFTNQEFNEFAEKLFQYSMQELHKS